MFRRKHTKILIGVLRLFNSLTHLEKKNTLKMIKLNIGTVEQWAVFYMEKEAQRWNVIG